MPKAVVTLVHALWSLPMVEDVGEIASLFGSPRYASIVNITDTRTL